MAILIGIAGLGLFITMDTYRHTSLREERDVLVSMLTRARTLSMTNTGGLPHGVCYETENNLYRVFKGDGQVEIEISKGNSITISGMPTCESGGIVFSQLSGTTTETTIVLSENTNSLVVEVSGEGTILY